MSGQVTSRSPLVAASQLEMSWEVGAGEWAPDLEVSLGGRGLSNASFFSGVATKLGPALALEWDHSGGGGECRAGSTALLAVRMCGREYQRAAKVLSQLRWQE